MVTSTTPLPVPGIPEPEYQVNVVALVCLVSVASLVLIAGLIKHIVQRANRPEGNIFHGYVVGVELRGRPHGASIQNNDERSQRNETTPNGNNNDEPPSYETIQMELPSYEEISSKQAL